MPDTGWTKPTVDGVYWWRLNQGDPPDAVRVKGKVFYDFADSDPTSIGLGEFLGPITHSDSEQLVRLREIAGKVLKHLSHVDINRGAEREDPFVTELRAALETKP